MKAFKPVDAGVAHQIGRYADAVVVPAGCQQIFVSGTPGLTPDGTLPADFADECRQAWQNVEGILSRAGAQLGDVVSIRQWLTDAADIPAYVAVRSEVITHETSSMLAVIPGLVRPEMKVEVEVIAVLPQVDTAG